ncbi:MAG: hypothetical protein GC131_02575 [Alphaproteobacteria bacterium]|nr:hypothetical protein [Alphaproteobacteria bacterium]
MRHNFHRYFIELTPEPENRLPGDERAPPARKEAVAASRAAAVEFVTLIREWLTERGMAAQVDKIEVTAMGQVQIVCHDDVIAAIREQDVLPIAQIRQGKHIANQIGRMEEARGENDIF